MKLLEFIQSDSENNDWEIRNLDKLDHILIKLADMVVRGQKEEPGYFGLVAACVLDPENKIVARLNIPAEGGLRIHAERAAMVAYYKKYGEIPKGSIILTTLSPCCDEMSDRAGTSCTELVNSSPVHKVYCGYIDPSQHNHGARQFTLQETNNTSLRELCKTLADTFLKDDTKGNDSRIDTAQFKEILKKFLPFAKKFVKIENMPVIILKSNISLNDQPTMGRYHSDDNVLELAVANRHPVDILRTLAHELVHAKQNSKNVTIDPTTGSRDENQANVVAGIIMRHFNKKYPEFLSFQPVKEGIARGRKRIC